MGTKKCSHVSISFCVNMPHLHMCLHANVFMSLYVASNSWLLFFLLIASISSPSPPILNEQSSTQLVRLLIRVRATYPFLKNHLQLKNMLYCMCRIFLYCTAYIFAFFFFRSHNSSCVRSIRRSIFSFIVHMGIIAQDI